LLLLLLLLAVKTLAKVLLLLKVLLVFLPKVLLLLMFCVATASNFAATPTGAVPANEKELVVGAAGVLRGGAAAWFSNV
jgi:hypothetical protein